MNFENLKEGQPIQNQPLFEKENLLEWKSNFENMWNQMIKIFGILILLVISNQRKQVFENQDN